MVPACSDLDLWPLIPEANQHICEPKYLYYMTKIGWNFLHWFVTYGVHKVLGSLPAVIFWPNQYFPGPVHTWPNVGKICSNILRAYCIHPIFGSLPAVTLTLWSQKLISTSVNPKTHVDQNWMKFLLLVFEICSQGFRIIACCDLDLWPQKLISSCTNPSTSVTKIGWNSLHWFFFCQCVCCDRVSNTTGNSGNLLEISKVSWKFSGWLKILVLHSVPVKHLAVNQD